MAATKVDLRVVLKVLTMVAKTAARRDDKKAETTAASSVESKVYWRVG